MKHPMGFRAPQDQPPVFVPKDRWETNIVDTYNVMRADKSWGQEYEENVKSIMNEMGDEGWELVSIGPSSLEPKGHERMVFKRRR